MEDALDHEDKHALYTVYKTMYPRSSFSEDEMSHIICKYSHLQIGDQNYGSIRERRGKKSARLMASWLNMDGAIDPQNSSMRPGVVSHYISHKLMTNEGGRLLTFVFAIMQWNKLALAAVHSRYLWKDDEYESGGSSCFLPVQRIHCRIVAGLRKNHTTYLMPCPITRKVLSS